MDTRALTNGRDRSKGWTQDEDGNWTPSVQDRRRLVTHSLIGLLKAEGQAGPEDLELLVETHSTGPEDFEALGSELGRWLARNMKQG